MANYIVTDTDLTGVADAIRTKGGTSAPLLFPTEFVQAIEDIPSGGGGSGTKTVAVNTVGIDFVWVDANGNVNHQRQFTMTDQWESLSGSLVCFSYSTLEPGTTLSVTNAQIISQTDHGSRTTYRYTCVCQVN